MFGRSKLLHVPEAGEAIPGRETRPFALPEIHAVLETPLEGPVPEGHTEVLVGLGCFWGAERRFWELTGVHVTAAGYAGGHTPNPTYEEVCTGRTGHAEVVRVVFDPRVLPYRDLWRTFWEAHDPTQGMQQGNDVGTQYRSVIYAGDEEARSEAEATRKAYQEALDEAGRGEITTDIAGARPFYYAEGYHQQYLAKNPNGYCGLGGTGVACPTPG